MQLVDLFQCSRVLTSGTLHICKAWCYAVCFGLWWRNGACTQEKMGAGLSCPCWESWTSSNTFAARSSLSGSSSKRACVPLHIPWCLSFFFYFTNGMYLENSMSMMEWARIWLLQRHPTAQKSTSIYTCHVVYVVLPNCCNASIAQGERERVSAKHAESRQNDIVGSH